MVEAWGASWEDCLAEAVRALAACFVDTSAVGATATVPVVFAAAHATGPHGQDVTTFPLSPQTVADRLGGTLLPPTPPPQPKTENPPSTSP